MKAAAFDYVRAHSLDEAIASLGGRADAKLIAGGQSLGPMLNLRLARPSLLVDISRLERLRSIEDGGEFWRLGGGVTHAQLEDASGQLPGGEMLCEVAAGIAYRSVRNRGTIGGSLAHADPAADWPLALAALGATVATRGAKGVSRRIAAETFMVSTFTTALREDEIIEYVDVPKLSASARYGYFKFCRRAGEFPDASAALVLDSARDVTGLFLGCLHGPPKRLDGLEPGLVARGVAVLRREAVEDAVASAAPELDAVVRRMHVGAVLRAVQRAFAA